MAQQLQYWTHAHRGNLHKKHEIVPIRALGLPLLPEVHWQWTGLLGGVPLSPGGWHWLNIQASVKMPHPCSSSQPHLNSGAHNEDKSRRGVGKKGIAGGQGTKGGEGSKFIVHIHETVKGRKCKWVTEYTDWQGLEKGLQQLFCYARCTLFYLGWAIENFKGKDKCGNHVRGDWNNKGKKR